jgi:hypothetical protein
MLTGVEPVDLAELVFKTSKLPLLNSTKKIPEPGFEPGMN